MTRAAGVSTLLVLALAGCATPPPAPPVASVYAYVLLGPDGHAVARVVTSAMACPSLDVDGRSVPMSVRAEPATLPLRPGQLKASAFPVGVCEAMLPPGAQRARLGDKALPLPRAAPQRIVVIGDTGCRLFAFEPAYQRCNDPAQWPFAAVAASAAVANPDLVIHVGDYHYRESACPPSQAGCAGSPWGYGFDAWEADFFAPARPLLEQAPWIVVRGNHESCSRAGQGWWRLLDPRPLAAAQDCIDAADDGTGNYSAPYAVPLGGDARVLVFDSSNAGNNPIPVDGPTYRIYKAQLAEALAGDGVAGATLFAVHHPPLAFAANNDRPASPYRGNAALQATLSPMYGDALFPPAVGAVVSGHIHAFEAVTFVSGQPPQFIFGDGGTAADSPLPDPFPAGLTPSAGAVVAELVYTNRFGFATLDRTPGGWTLRAYGVTGAPMTTCTLRGRAAACVRLGPAG